MRSAHCKYETLINVTLSLLKQSLKCKLLHSTDRTPFIGVAVDAVLVHIEVHQVQFVEHAAAGVGYLLEKSSPGRSIDM